MAGRPPLQGHASFSHTFVPAFIWLSLLGVSSPAYLLGRPLLLAHPSKLKSVGNLSRLDEVDRGTVHKQYEYVFPPLVLKYFIFYTVNP